MNESTGFQNFRRSREVRLIAGVCGAISERVPVDVNLIRLGFVIASFFGFFGVFVYLAAWLLIPEQGASRSIAARMVGQKPAS